MATISRYFDDWDRELFHDPKAGSFSTDIRQVEDGFVLEADLPGFRKDHIHVDISDTTLTITAERATGDDKKKYLRRERSYGSFSRSFNLQGIDIDGIQASFVDGVLTVKLPYYVEKKPENRRLTIQ